jgi:multiple sugar transport system permease protein
VSTLKETKPAVRAAGATHARAARPEGRKSRLTRQQSRAGWWLLSPALLHSTFFLAVPAVIAIFLSFTDYDFSGTWKLIGIENYTELFQDTRFQAALRNTIAYTLVVVPLSMALALLIALGLNLKIRGLGFFRTVYYLPVVTATVAAASVWLWIYHPSAGLANAVGSLFGLARSEWLNDPGTALPALMAVGIWQGLGAKMIVYLAALQGVSKELLEAANLDGANRWQVFRNVIWPALGPAHYFVLITAIVQTFQVFDLVFVMTKGGPVNSTTVLTFDIYNNAFEGLRLGYASAETVIMLILIAVFIYLGGRSQRNTQDGQ